MGEIDPGYKFAVEVLLPLNHDRYKSYFYQFSLLELGLFTAMNLKMIEGSPLIALFALIGIGFSYIWIKVLKKLNSDIEQLWELIETHEGNLLNQAIKIKDSRSDLYPSGKTMQAIPYCFACAHFIVAFKVLF